MTIAHPRAAEARFAIRTHAFIPACFDNAQTLSIDPRRDRHATNDELP
jgi:hypothetical protein